MKNKKTIADTIIETINEYKEQLEKELSKDGGQIAIVINYGDLSILEHEYGYRDDICIRIERIKKR